MEVCKVGHKNLRMNSPGWRTFVGAKILLQKSLKVQPDNVMSLTLFWILADVPNCARLFLCARNLEKCLIDLKFLSFNSTRVKLGVYEGILWLLFDFSYFWQKVEREGNNYTNLNNCRICFFLLCNYKNNFSVEKACCSKGKFYGFG